MQPQQHPPQQSIQQQTSNRVQKELSIVSIWKIYITKLKKKCSELLKNLGI